MVDSRLEFRIQPFFLNGTGTRYRYKKIMALEEILSQLSL